MVAHGHCSASLAASLALVRPLALRRAIPTHALQWHHDGALSSCCTSMPIALQRRWWYHDVGASRKNYDKPLIHTLSPVYVRGQIPVVLLKNMKGIGRKGQIVNVKRGYARHHLVPKGLAVLGTWENIDEYANPALVDDPALKARVTSERGRLPFDWVDEIQLRFVRRAREDQLQKLMEPISVWEILQELSNNHELDLLPSNVDIPDGGVAEVGITEVPLRIAFRDPESAAGRYTILLEVVSEQSLLEEQRRQEMSQALSESRRFSIPRRFGASQGGGGFDDEAETPPEIADSQYDDKS